MAYDFDSLADLADAEFFGESYNGKSLMATLAKISASDSASNSTYEGYSAWSVVLHLAWCKWLVRGAFLDEGAKAEPYPYPVGKGGFAEPIDKGEEAWKACIAYFESLHRETMKAIRLHAADRYDETMEAWGIPKGKAAVWLCSHDTYHTAQIRNMGVPGFKAKRAY